MHDPDGERELTGSDATAVEAVRQFCRRSRAHREEKTMLADLILPLLPRIGDEARRTVAALLAGCDFAPKALLLALSDFRVAVCSPVLTRSRLLSDPELLAIISQHGEDHARAIARRPALTFPVVSALRAMNSAGVDRALDLRQRVEPPARQDAAQSLAAPKEAPRQIATGNPSPCEPHAVAPSEALARFPRRTGTDHGELLELAREQNRTLLHTAFADGLCVTVASAAALCSDPTSRNLIHALRFMETPTSVAGEIFQCLAPGLSKQEGVMTRFEAVYDSVTPDQAARKVLQWRSDDLLALAREALAANDSSATANDMNDGETARYIA